MVREYEQISRETDLPLGAGALAMGRREVSRLLNRARLDLLALDPRVCGGLTGAYRLSLLADAHDLPVALMAGDWPGTTWLVHCLAATSSRYLPTPRPCLADDESYPGTFSQGLLTLDRTPGPWALSEQQRSLYREVQEP
jgi:L-alanine-DL-glutamate epimerase-like enolase superfamily enzyme